MFHDGKCRAAVANSVHVAVAWYLMAAHAYEHMAGTSILSDGCYDELCRLLDKEWRRIEHRHKRLIRRSSLRSTSAHYLKMEELPLRVRLATEMLINELPDPTVDLLEPAARPERLRPIRTRTR